MRRHTSGSRAWWLTGLALAFGGAMNGGCSNANTVVHVTVTGDVEGIVQLVVDVNLDGLDTMLYVPPNADVVTLPTDFSIETDRSRTGELILTISGYNANAMNNPDAMKIASGMGDIPAILVGQQNEVSVELTAEAPPTTPDPDGGAGGDGDTTTDDAGP